ncbi:unnamed protein product, partial [Dibothriocephalus latus]
MSLIEDLFPGIVLDKCTYPDLQKAVTNQAEILNLVNDPAWNLKVVQ